MMVDLLAQTTQPTGMKTWGPLEWTAFFTAAGVFIGGLVTGIIAIINAARANTKADSNEKRIEGQDKRLGAHEQSLQQINREMPSPVAPTPEAQARAFDAARREQGQ